jgi:hypothetical protein
MSVLATMETQFNASFGDASSPTTAYLAGQTTLPSTLTYSSMTRQINQPWVGVGA